MKPMAAAVPQAIRDAVDRWNAVRVFDNVLADPDGFRAAVLSAPAQTVDFGGGQVFHGIRLLPAPLVAVVRAALATAPVPDAELGFTFARQSPAGQIEPNDVHSDADHGDWTAILYLNPIPAEGDGTLFWRRKATGAARGLWDAGCQAESHDRAAWDVWRRVEARYNRLLVFQSDYFHSRSIVSNYGEGEDARLIVVAFLTCRAPGVAHV